MTKQSMGSEGKKKHKENKDLFITECRQNPVYVKFSLT